MLELKKKIVVMKNFYLLHQGIINSILLAIIPVFCCGIVSLVYGKLITQVYLPSNEWNDELFYYKQVESMLYGGIPKGYFGYNESRALLGSFASWSPVILIPWYLWGLLFGWSFSAPLYCNIALLSCAFFVFARLASPNIKQVFTIAVTFAAFFPVTRWMLSGTPEVSIISILIIFISLLYSYSTEDKKWKIILIDSIIFVLTLMRPYFIIFGLFPVYISLRKKTRRIFTILLGLVTLICYYFISHYLCAEYFIPIINIDWLFSIKSVKDFVYYVYMIAIDFCKQLINGVINKSFEGTVSISFILIFIFLIIETIKSIKIKDKKNEFIYGILTLCFFGLLMGVFFLYTLPQGSRHMMSFIVIGIIVICMDHQKINVKAIILTVVFIILFIIPMKKDPFVYKVHFYDENTAVTIDDMKQELNATMVVSDDVSYDNTLIWVIGDTVNEEFAMLRWQLLYSTPKGIGINLCAPDYILENIEILKSRYIATVPNGSIDIILKNSNRSPLFENSEIIIYDLKVD